MRLKICRLTLAVCGLLALCGCSAPSAQSAPSSQNVSTSSQSTAAPSSQNQSSFLDETPAGGSSSNSSSFTLKTITPGSVYTGEIVILTPEATGEKVFADSKYGLTVDVSNAAEGYIMARCTNADSRIKLRILHGSDYYTYDLRRDGVYEVYPLQMGSGSYSFAVYKQVKGTSYAEVLADSFTATMPDVDRVFVYPNQYVWYTNDKNATKLSYDLCDGISDQAVKVQRIYDYLDWYLTYDDDKAEAAKNNEIAGYLPDLDSILKQRKGICFDYAALLAAMCRAQGIPVRLVIGYVQPGNIYHAWNSVYLDGKWVWMDATFGPNSSYKESNYTEDTRY